MVSTAPYVTSAYASEAGTREADSAVYCRVNHLVEIEGVVEYKSLPSGLHHVSNDLVYASFMGMLTRSSRR